MVKIDGANIRNQGRKTGWMGHQAAIGSVRGKRVKITPAESISVNDKKDFEKNGAVVGFLETEVEGDETQLPPGKYYLWAVKDPTEGWVGYAVDEEGNVHARAARVQVTESPPRKTKGPPRKASVHEEGFFVQIFMFVWAVGVLVWIQYAIVMFW